MGDVLEDATARARESWPIVVGALVALMLPSLLMTASDAPGSVSVGVLALALAALARFGLRCTAGAAHPRTMSCPIDDRSAPVLTGRVTDPVHHPLRPRAPGLT